MRIILSGPDGTGKSTIVEGLHRHLRGGREVEVTWRRFGFILARGLNLVAKGMGWSYYEETPFEPVGYHHYRGVFARIYIIASFVDCLLVIMPRWWVHDQLNRSKTQIVDRYLIDITADLILSTANSRAVLWCFHHILKRHIRKETCIVLTCDPKVVIQRRPDIIYDRSYLDKVRIYRLLRKLYGIREIATDETTPQACVKKVVSICV